MMSVSSLKEWEGGYGEEGEVEANSLIDIPPTGMVPPGVWYWSVGPTDSKRC